MAINVGDLVRITDRLFNYSQWSYMFRQMGFRNDEERDNPFQNGDVLRVFAVQPHPTTIGLTLYGLEHPTTRLGTQVLMNGHGIEWVLPERFAVRVTPDIKEELNNWRGGGLQNITRGYCLSLHQGYWVEDLYSRYSEYKLITSEQFRQYVLNQTTTDMPTPQLTPEEQYIVDATALNIQIGDIVRVTQRLRSHDRGWENSWTDIMDTFVGNEYEALSIGATSNSGVLLRGASGGGYRFPIYSLEVVRRANGEPANTHTPAPIPEQTNLENEQEDAVVTTTDRVICMTDKWNYINLGEVYEVIKRDEYYTYVKDSVGGESRYAHHYFEEWVDAETKAKRDSFKALFGDHSISMFKNASDEVQKLMSELYPKLYEYNGWLKLKKESDYQSKWLFEGLGIRLITEEDTTNEKLHGTMRFDPMNFTLDTFLHQGYTYIRFKQNR